MRKQVIVDIVIRIESDCNIHVNDAKEMVTYCLVPFAKVEKVGEFTLL